MNFFTILCLCLSTLILSCQKGSDSEVSPLKWEKENPPILQPNEFKMDSGPVLIQNARIMTANGNVYDKAHLFMKAGKIQAISTDAIQTPADTLTIDGEGLTLTPGLIDVHSHMGVYPAPAIDAHMDGNEMVRPVTADIWAEHGFWPQDPDLWRAMAGGITTIQVLPGSGNLIGGRSLTAKLIPQLSALEMRFPGAPQGLKMACGENPKRVYKEKSIMTRMGNVARYRKVYQEALEYAREWEAYNKDKKSKMPKRNFVSETLAKVLKGEILVHFHCYRADDISAILDVAKEFGFKIRTIQHGLEAYKIASRLAQEDVGVATWADWWGFKAEAYDGIPYNAALLQKAGAKAIIHSDSAVDIRFLNVEAGKALSAAKKLGLHFTDDQALAWITKNAAWALGLQDKIGTLEKGKMADVVVWDGHPFSIYTKTKMVFINGKKVFDRAKQERIESDFEIGSREENLYDGRDFTPPQSQKNFATPQKYTPVEFNPAKTFAIQNALVFLDGSWQKDITVLVQEGRIADINPKNFPEGTQFINGKGRSLTPGLVSARTSIGLFDIALDSTSQDLGNRSKQPTPAFDASFALNLNGVRIPIARNEGVLTAVASISGGIATAMTVAFDMSAEQSAITPNLSLYGALDRTRVSGSMNSPKSRSARWFQLEQLIEDSVFFRDNTSAFYAGRTRPLPLQAQHYEAMQPLLKGKKPWVIHANRADDIKNLISLKTRAKKINVKLNFIIIGGAEAWKVADLLAKHRVPVILSPSMQTPKSFDQIFARFDSAAYLSAKGVPLILLDEDDPGNTRLRQEAGFAVKYGLTHNQAMQAITKTPAQAYGLPRGEIKKGAVANLVLWSGDPLEPTSWVLGTWIHGKQQDLKNRQLLLAKKYLDKIQ